MCKCSNFSSLLKVSANVLIFRNKLFRTMSDSGTISKLAVSDSPTYYELTIFKAESLKLFTYSNLSENYYGLYLSFRILGDGLTFVVNYFKTKIINFFSMNDLSKIPRKEARQKLLGFKASTNEVKKLKTFCRQQQITQSDFFRFAIRQIIQNF